MSPVSVHQKWGHMAPAGSLTPTPLGAVHVHIHRALGALATTSSMWPDTFSPAQPTEGPRWQFSSRSPWPLQPDRPGAPCLQPVTPHMALKGHFLLPHSLSASPRYLSGGGGTRWAERRSSAGPGQQTVQLAQGTVGQPPAWGPHTCGGMSWPAIMGRLGRNMASQASPRRKRERYQGFKGSHGCSLAREQEMAPRALGGKQCALKMLLLLLTIYQLSLWQSQQVLQPVIPTSLPYTHSNHAEHTVCTCGATP